MPKYFHKYTFPFLSLCLAFYFLNLSVGIPGHKQNRASILKEAEHILSPPAEADYHSQQPDTSPEAPNKGIEKETLEDSVDFINYSAIPALSNTFFLTLQSKHAHHLGLSGRPLDTITPPPKV